MVDSIYSFSLFKIANHVIWHICCLCIAVGKSCLLLQFTDKRFQPVHDLTIGKFHIALHFYVTYFIELLWQLACNKCLHIVYSSDWIGLCDTVNL